MRTFRSVSLFLFLAVSLSALAADLKVAVTDPQGAAVSGARVTLYRAGSSDAVEVAETTAEGVATLPTPAPGDYRVEVLAPGFAPQSADVRVPASARLTVQLAVAGPDRTVVVSATGTPVPGEEAGAPVESLDQRELRTMQPVDLGEALRFVPGAVVSTTGQRGSLTSLFVRGGESRYNKVLIDGVPVNDDDGFFNFGVVSVAGVDRLELLRGADSVVYGSDAMTSVVGVESAPGRTRTPELWLGADGGSFSTAHGFASLAGARGRFDYHLFGEQVNTDGDGVNNDYSNSAQGGNVGVAFTPQVRLRLRARHSNNRTGISSAWNFNGAPLLPPDLDEFSRQNDLLGSATLEIDAPSRWQHRLDGYEYSHRLFSQDLVSDRGCDFVTVFLDCPFKALTQFNRAGLDYQGEYTARSWARIVFGYNYEDEHGDTRDLLLGGSSPGLRRSHGVYGELLMAGPMGSLVAGVRYVHNEAFGNKVVPRLAGMLSLSRRRFLSRTHLRFALSEGIKAPDFLETFGNPAFFILPNPNLKAEQNLSVEGGVVQDLMPNWNLSATYFHNSFTNRIDFESLGPPTFEAVFVNLNKVLAHGAEVELQGRVRGLTVRGAYFYTSTQVLEAPLAPATVGQPLLRRPKHSGLFQLMYLRSRWGGTLGASFVGRRTDSDFLGLGIDHAPGYVRVDLGGWYALRHDLTATLKIENALDHSYNEVVGFPALGIGVRAGLQLRLGGD